MKCGASPYLSIHACVAGNLGPYWKPEMHRLNTRKISGQKKFVGRELIPSSALARDGGGGGDSGGGFGGGGSGGGDSGGEESRQPEQQGNFWGWYLALLGSRPLLTKGITAALLNVLSDVFCQLVVEKSSTIDLKRIFGFAAIGGLLVGPALHIWYGILGRVVTVDGSPGVLLRLVLDQFVFSPVSIATFLGLVLLLEGNASKIEAKLKKDLWTTVSTMWKVWIPFQFLNFAIVPPQLQVGAANLVGLFWTVYMSFAAHNDLESSSVESSKETP